MQFHGRSLVLVIDDDPEVRLLLETFLETEGFRVAVAVDGDEGAQEAARLVPAVVLLDYAMPHVDGWECAERLRTNPCTAQIPIVAITAHTAQENRNRAMYSGVDGFITKPFECGAVLHEIHRVLTNGEARAATRRRRTAL